MSKSIASRIPFILLLAAVITMLVYLNLPQPEKGGKQHQRVVSVKAVSAERTLFKDVIEALGNVRANEQVLITSQSSEVVSSIDFEDGELVKKGDILVRLNKQEEEAKVKELEANLAESVAQLNRYQDLLKRKATSKSQVDEQEAQTKAISAQLLSARAKLNEFTIVAPFDGVLGFREISLGSYIKSGDVITSLDDIAVVKVDFAIPERFFTTVKIGQTIAAANTAYENESFIGKITSVDPRIDATTRMVRVRAEIPNTDYKLRPGMLLTIEVERKVEQVLQIPESAIIPIEDNQYVFVVEGDKALRKTVKIGRRKPGIAEVLSGLNESEQVVVEGALKLREGSKVSLVGAKAENKANSESKSNTENKSE